MRSSLCYRIPRSWYKFFSSRMDTNRVLWNGKTLTCILSYAVYAIGMRRTWLILVFYSNLNTRFIASLSSSVCFSVCLVFFYTMIAVSPQPCISAHFEFLLNSCFHPFYNLLAEVTARWCGINTIFCTTQHCRTTTTNATTTTTAGVHWTKWFRAPSTSILQLYWVKQYLC